MHMVFVENLENIKNVKEGKYYHNLTFQYFSFSLLVFL